jgi:hypothetical protein
MHNVQSIAEGAGRWLREEQAQGGPHLPPALSRRSGGILLVQRNPEVLQTFLREGAGVTKWQ